MRLQCPVHRCYTPDGECPTCKAQDLRVIECEIDKIDRVIGTLDQQGYTRSRYSHAILIFHPSGQPDPLDESPTEA